jgi:hypothetical protein
MKENLAEVIAVFPNQIKIAVDNIDEFINHSGVKKSFEITQDHFMEHYGKKARFFIYNSSNLNQLDSFSSSAGINVMI